MSDITHAYLGGLVHKRGDDGFLYVTGLVSDDTLDLDQQRCDPQWLDVSVPKWLKSAGNVRLMHQPVAVGKAQSIEKQGTGWGTTIKVTNPQTATDIEEGVLTGLSVGIKNYQLEKSMSAPKGLIVGGDIIEVSLVDRPANPSCTIEMAKSAGNEWEFKGVEVFGGNQTDVVITQPITPDLEVGESFIPTADAALGDPEADKDIEAAADAQENISDAEDFLNIDEKAAKVCSTCDGKGTIMDGNRDCPDCDGKKSANPDNVSVSENDDDLAKAFDFSDEDLAKFQKVLDGIVAKRKVVQDIPEIVQETTITGDDDMANAFVTLGVSADLFKSATAEDATDETKTELRAEMRKAVGFDEEIAIYKAQITELQETVVTVKAALEEVQEMATPGGPVLRQTSDQRRKSAAHDTISTKAAELRARADAFTGEPSVKQALYVEAEKLEAALSSL